MSFRKYAILDGIDEQTIWTCRQNHPELVVQDLKETFQLTQDECDQIRWILMKRGINKWLYARRLFIDLKHKMKPILHQLYEGELGFKESRKEYQKTYAGLQNICKMPRWVEWGPTHKNMTKCDDEIIVRGGRC